MSHYFFYYLYIYYLYSIPLGTLYIIHSYKLFVTQAEIFLYTRNNTIYMCTIVINARDSLYMYYNNYSPPRNMQTTTTILLLIIHFTLQLSGCDMYNQLYRIICIQIHALCINIFLDQVGTSKQSYNTIHSIYKNHLEIDYYIQKTRIMASDAWRWPISKCNFSYLVLHSCSISHHHGLWPGFNETSSENFGGIGNSVFFYHYRNN